MKNTNTILLIVLIVAVIGVGAGVIYSLNQTTESEPATTQEVDSSTQETPISDENTQTQTQPTDSSQVIDGVDIPSSVLADIERDYPDYIIEDAERETRAGQAYYEIELEHRDPANDSEYELTYDANWGLIEAKFDQD